VCRLDNLNSVPDVIFCVLIAFLVVGAQGCRDKLVGDEALRMQHKVLYIHIHTYSHKTQQLYIISSNI